LAFGRSFVLNFQKGERPREILTNHRVSCSCSCLGFLTFIEGLVNIAEMGENEGEVWELEGKIAKGGRTKTK